MRVISGQARGLKLASPEGLDTRPTTDRVKESMFNIIAPYLPAEDILDLFSGSGALGIEALSRNSKHGVFVESDRSALSILKQNLERARQAQKAEVMPIDAFTYLSRANVKFDIIFLDPPYNKGLLTRAVNEVAEKGLLKDGGIIVAESEAGGEVPPSGSFHILKSAKYGKTMVFVLGNAQTQGR
ncbi:MAG: 16S rRNA (guanine(966)-N(2))-methyltransferase RsmD [Clostridia bacterium]|nr:16S rRNA (guanine(966)-N(2))-methyltransferase RsmD [Clostridia bacterium]